jgi:hypothetical protein
VESVVVLSGTLFCSSDTILFSLFLEELAHRTHRHKHSGPAVVVAQDLKAEFCVKIPGQPGLFAPADEASAAFQG